MTLRPVPPMNGGLSLAPFRALRPKVAADRLGRLLCPPYDVIGQVARKELLAADPDNMVGVILPEPTDGTDPYQMAAARLRSWVATGLLAPDDAPAIYVYEMRPRGTTATRGLLGAVELRDPADGVILPHEDTMAGPVADRLALMSATEADLEPIYLVYDGGGIASQVVQDAESLPLLASAATPDGTTHRLWAVSDAGVHQQIAADLAARHALIADGHHRYATYRELQRRLRAERGAGPWDRGLALLVDSQRYGAHVHAIHRVVPLALAEAARRAETSARVTPVATVDAALDAIANAPQFAAVLTDGVDTAIISDLDPELIAASGDGGHVDALTNLDVTVLHHVLVRRIWRLPDAEEVVGYAHSVPDAIADAQQRAGTAVLLRPTPVSAVAQVAATGARMPRKSTLFTPKPASGLVMRRFVDDTAGS
jgi:uncharacterized protein (DUF1015 family)